MKTLLLFLMMVLSGNLRAADPVNGGLVDTRNDYSFYINGAVNSLKSNASSCHYNGASNLSSLTLWTGAGTMTGYATLYATIRPMP